MPIVFDLLATVMRSPHLAAKRLRMKAALNLIAPVLAGGTAWAALSGHAPVWLLAALTLLLAGVAVHRGGRVLPAAAAATVCVMSLLWAYTALAFIVLLVAVVAVSTLVRT